MRWLGSLCVVVLLAASTAGAQDVAPPRTVPTTDFVWSGHAGAFLAEHSGVLCGVAASLRWRFVQAGVVGQMGGQLGSDNAISAGSTAGFAWRMDNGLRLDALGVIGARWYFDVGRETLDDDPGTSALLGYAGAMGGVSYAYRSGERLHGPALWISYDRDLTQVTREYSYIDHPGIGAIFGSDDRRVTRRRVIGGARLALLVSFGVTLDL